MSDCCFVTGNLINVSSDLKKACAVSGRPEESVKLICVSKTKPIEMLLEAYKSGYREFGENKVQEICAKAPLMPSDTVFHMIGHLQKNKVKKAVAFSKYIHSVDSYELAELINSEAEKIDKIQNILIEVNIASEDSKYGVRPDEVSDFIKRISGMSNICICGLMCVAPYTENPESNRQYFAEMRNLMEKINSDIDGVSMQMLSMGMSGDYKVAIEEGATHIRVGTAIFGERDYTK